MSREATLFQRHLVFCRNAFHQTPLRRNIARTHTSAHGNNDKNNFTTSTRYYTNLYEPTHTYTRYNNVVIIYSENHRQTNSVTGGVHTACCRWREERVCFRYTLNSPTELWGRGGFYIFCSSVAFADYPSQVFHSLHGCIRINILYNII